MAIVQPYDVERKSSTRRVDGSVFDVSADSSQVEYRNGGEAHDLL
jgi:hypothetical protein